MKNWPKPVSRGYVFFFFFVFLLPSPLTNLIYAFQTAETKPVKGLDGNTWHEVDVEATIAAHPDDAFEGLDDAINDYILHFDQQPSESNKNKRHMRAIWASESFASRVLGDPSC
jgi:hypothetical protein